MSYGLAYTPYNTNLFLNSIDLEAQAFITATGITGATQQQAIDTLVKSLKANNLWSKMKAVYPFVTDNRNLLGYTENLNNSSWNKGGSTVIANNAIAPDGSNTGWRVTRINSALQGFALRQDVPITSGVVCTFSVYLKAPNLSTTIQLDLGDSVPNPIITLTTEWQLYTFVRTTGAGGGFIDFNIASGDGSYCWFWHPQLELGSTATTYQPIATTQQAFISSQFKYNLVNPVDSDAAFRLVFNGGWTHSSNGATPNGTNGYTDTKLNENTVMTLNDIHLSHYSRTNNTSNVCDIGIFNNSSITGTHTIVYSSGNCAVRNTDNGGITTATARTDGHFINTRIVSTQVKYFWNSALHLTSASNSVSKNNLVYFLGARNNDGAAALFSNRQLAFTSIGNGLLDAEATALYNIVQNFQLALNRAV